MAVAIYTRDETAFCSMQRGESAGGGLGFYGGSVMG